MVCAVLEPSALFKNLHSHSIATEKRNRYVYTCLIRDCNNKSVIDKRVQVGNDKKKGKSERNFELGKTKLTITYTNKMYR